MRNCSLIFWCKKSKARVRESFSNRALTQQCWVNTINNSILRKFFFCNLRIAHWNHTIYHPFKAKLVETQNDTLLFSSRFSENINCLERTLALISVLVSNRFSFESDVIFRIWKPWRKLEFTLRIMMMMDSSDLNNITIDINDEGPVSLDQIRMEESERSR